MSKKNDWSGSIFIRHKMSASKETLKTLWKDRKIAIHFTHDERMKDGGKAYKYAHDMLEKCGKNGAFVGADFREAGGEYGSKMLVGQVEHGTKIMEETLGKYEYETMRLKNPKEVPYVDYPILLVGRPRRTIDNWPKFKPILEAISTGKKLHRAVTNLYPPPS